MITIIIKTEDVFNLAQRHLGAIGKRVRDDNGKTDFDMFVLQSNEMELISHYTKEAARKICAIAPERVINYSSTDDGCELIIDGGRDRELVISTEESTAKTDELLYYQCVNAFLLNYTLAQYLSMTLPNYAKKYAEEAESTLKDLQNVLFIKEVPKNNISLEQTTGSCS